jgi:hypothetical protein
MSYDASNSVSNTNTVVVTNISFAEKVNSKLFQKWEDRIERDMLNNNVPYATIEDRNLNKYAEWVIKVLKPYLTKKGLDVTIMEDKAGVSGIKVSIPI